MALSDDIISEQTLPGLFFDTDELARPRNFGLSDGSGGITCISIPALIDNEITKRFPLASQQGLYMGDLMVFVNAALFLQAFFVKPKAQSIIYVDGRQYRIITSHDNPITQQIELGLEEVRVH